ncbi:MAG: hypothetical protein LBU95_02600, partial [Rikenellaceae bacterium]|nr:hypothetical protein [Rikenellaceae bacterium]
MRKIITTAAAFTAALFLALPNLAAQTSAYTILLNKSPEDKNFAAMIGLVNVAQGNNKGVMVGFMDEVGGWQRGTMMGLYNSVGGLATGAQFGLINTFGEQQGG